MIRVDAVWMAAEPLDVVEHGERFFRDITVNRLRRGVFTSEPELVTAIDEYVAYHNTKSKPIHLYQERCRHPVGLGILP